MQMAEQSSDARYQQRDTQQSSRHLLPRRSPSRYHCTAFGKMNQPRARVLKHVNDISTAVEAGPDPGCCDLEASIEHAVQAFSHANPAISKMPE